MSIITRDQVWMERALQVAASGLGTVQPNPMVGAVIIYQNRIIGEGWHQQYGEAHAEVNAINSVKDKNLLPLSTLYVNLEPCSHFGKTPPCADLIIKSQIPKVVISTLDPNKKVAGKGIAKLEKAKIFVKQNILAEEAIQLNKRFFTFHIKKRPYIILKWAETLNGLMDIERKREDSPENYWITNPELRILTHKMRNEEQAIAIGYNTFINDHPQLTNRLYGSHQLQRFIFSNNEETEEVENFTFLPSNPEKALQILFEKNIQSIIIEGGKKTLEQFLAANLWDEAIVLTGDQVWENGIHAPKINLNFDRQVNILTNKLTHYNNFSTSFFKDYLSS